MVGIRGVAVFAIIVAISGGCSSAAPARPEGAVSQAVPTNHVNGNDPVEVTTELDAGFSQHVSMDSATWIGLVPRVGNSGLSVIRSSEAVPTPTFDLPMRSPASSADEAEFESLLGFPYGSITLSAVFRISDDGMWVIKTDEPVADAIDRVLAHPHWGGLAQVSFPGEWTLIDFGDDIDVAQQSELRPIGRGGMLAFRDDGIVVWSQRPGPVLATVSRSKPSALVSLSELIDSINWDRALWVTPLVFDGSMPGVSAQLIYKLRQSLYRPDKTLMFHTAVTWLYDSSSLSLTLLIEHQTEAQANANADHFQGAWQRSVTVDPNLTPFSEVGELRGISQVGRVVVVEMSLHEPIRIDDYAHDPLFRLVIPAGGATTP